MSNPCLPNIIKVGKTKNISNRQKQLSKTSTPFPFVIEFFVESEHDHELEKLLKYRLGKFRINKRREFFDSTVEDAIEALTSIAKNLDSGIKYLPLNLISDEELEQVCSSWNIDYDYSSR